jgi:hypothetical protein
MNWCEQCVYLRLSGCFRVTLLRATTTGWMLQALHISKVEWAL